MSGAPLTIAHACVTEGMNGPGRRFTVWAQGCLRRCPGCFNPGLLPFEPGRRVSPEALAEEAAEQGPLGGVSLSGGEPFGQAAGLSAFVDALRCRPGLAGLTVVAFTGFTVEELRAGSEEQAELLSRVDLLVDGPYRREEAAPLALRGSRNQRLLALSPAGGKLIEEAERLLPGAFAVTVSGTGEVILTGFPPASLAASLGAAFRP